MDCSKCPITVSSQKNEHEEEYKKTLWPNWNVDHSLHTHIYCCTARTHARTQWGSTTKQVSLVCTYIAGCSVLMGPGSLGRCRDIAAQSSVKSVCVLYVWVREPVYVCCVRVWRPALLPLLLLLVF